MRLRGLEMKYPGACFEIVIWAQEPKVKIKNKIMTYLWY
jgi:hypothetical protein